MADKSMLEIAYEEMKEKRDMSFNTIWNAVSKKLGLTDEEKAKKVANFYTQLSLDGRFVALGNNKWSLRDRLKFEKVHVDLSAIYAEMDAESEGDDEDEETPITEEKKEDVASVEENL